MKPGGVSRWQSGVIDEATCNSASSSSMPCVVERKWLMEKKASEEEHFALRRLKPIWKSNPYTVFPASATNIHPMQSATSIMSSTITILFPPRIDGIRIFLSISHKQAIALISSASGASRCECVSLIPPRSKTKSGPVASQKRLNQVAISLEFSCLITPMSASILAPSST